MFSHRFPWQKHQRSPAQRSSRLHLDNVMMDRPEAGAVAELWPVWTNVAVGRNISIHSCIQYIHIYIQTNKQTYKCSNPPPPGPWSWVPLCGVVGVWYGMVGMYGVYGRSGMACLECMVGMVCKSGRVCLIWQYVWSVWYVWLLWWVWNVSYVR